MRHNPAIQSGKELIVTANSITAAAQLVSILAHSMVLRRPIVSKRAPVRIRPKPLHMDNTPTRDTAKASGAYTDRARSLAKLITELPTAARQEIQIKAIQKEGRQSICREV